MADAPRAQTGDDARGLAGMFTELDRHRRTLSQQASLGTADMRLMWLLTDGEPRTLKQIAERLGLEQSTANRQVNAAVAAGLVERTREGPPNPYRFTASRQGAQEFEQNLHSALDIYRHGLEALGPHREQFLTLLGRFLTAFEGALGDEPGSAPGAAPPPAR